VRKDLLFSEDGDLVLGAPLTNEDDELLYVTEDGEITTDETQGTLIRDMQVATNFFAKQQIIYTRLKSSKGDWFLYPDLGPSLETLVGQPNTRETAQKGVDMIIQSLTFDGFLSPSEINVRPVPINESEILFYLEITENELRYPIPVVLNLEIGIIRKYEV
jgi:hypothetical protein